jgi:uncharacterized protein
MTQTLTKMLIAALTLTLPFASASAQSNPAPMESAELKPINQAAPVQIEAKPALWVVKDADTTIYLFGTVHILKPNLAWFDEEVKSAFDQSDRLVLEMVEPPAAQSQTMFTKLAIDKSGKPLRSKMTEADRATYDKAMAKIGLPVAAFDPLDPWAAAVTMEITGMVRQGFDPNNGAESVLTSAAEATNKPIEGVETMASQLAIFDTLPQKKQLRFLKDTVESMDDETAFGELVDAWAKPDPERLAQLMNEGLTDPELFARLLTRRNANWAKWIAKQMAKPGTTFMAVGAGHMSGATSVPALLPAYGLNAERVAY